MGDVLPPKRQTVVDRLRRRFELYRRHHNSVLPRFEQAASTLYESQKQDTALLKQRFLETKAKKAKSKSDHHRSYKEPISDSSKAQLHSKPLKRSSDDAITSETTGNEDSEKAAKIPRVEAAPLPDLPQQSILPTFSVQIVQQFSQSPLQQSTQTIQTNVTVQTLSKPQTPQSAGTAAKPAEAPPSNQEDRPQTAVPSIASIVPSVECKQEQDTGEPDLCQLKGSQASNQSGGDRLSDTFPSIEFTDESGENVIHPDLLNDLIEDVFTNSGDIMKDFNFEDSVGGLKDTQDTSKDIIDDLVKGASSGQLRSFQTDGLSFVNATTNAQTPNGLFRNIPVTSESSISNLSPSPVTTSSAFFNASSQRLPSFVNSAMPHPSGLGLDFKLTEPSPAALTLKQMAEQHQNMQQKQQQQLVNPSLTNRPQSFSQSTYSPHMRPANFLNGSGPAIQNSSPKMLNSGTNLFNAFDQCINSFSGDDTPSSFPGCEPLSPSNMFVSNRTSTATMTDSDVRALQMKLGGHPMEQQNPPAYCATRPLTHYADSAPVRHQNVGGGQQQQQRPVGRQFQSNPGVPLQMNQVQQLQPRQHNPQQLQQNACDMKQPHSVMQQHLNVYGNYPSQQPVANPTFHMSMSQSLTYSSQFGTNTALGRPPPEYKARRSALPDNMHLVEQLNAPSQMMFNPSAKGKFAKQQRPPNVTITPDGTAVSSSHDWRNNMISNNNSQQQFRVGPFVSQDNYNDLNSNGPVTASVPLSPMYNQYRMPTSQSAANRVVRPNRMPQGHVLLQQRQRMVIPQRLRNPSVTSMEQHSSVTLNSGALAPGNVMGPVYSETQDIERQDGNHLNFDFLDNIESSASDLLNFDQVMQGPHFPILDDMDILGK